MVSHLPTPTSTNVTNVRRDIENTLGMVPTWIDKAVPPNQIEAVWNNLKGFEMNPDTAIPPKYKELIGLAVSSQIPCRYCVLFHTEAAKLNGATNEEVNDAIYQASVTRQLSTIVNGFNQDFGEFQREIKSIVAYIQKNAESTAHTPTRPARRF